MDAPRESPQQVARGQDSDKAPVLGDERGAEILLHELLGDLAERVLRRDDEQVGGHDVSDGLFRLAERCLERRLEKTVTA